MLYEHKLCMISLDQKAFSGKIPMFARLTFLRFLNVGTRVANNETVSQRLLGRFGDSMQCDISCR